MKLSFKIPLSENGLWAALQLIEMAKKLGLSPDRDLELPDPIISGNSTGVKRARWTDEEDQKLYKLVNENKSWPAIGMTLNRTEKGVYMRAKRLGMLDQ